MSCADSALISCEDESACSDAMSPAALCDSDKVAWRVAVQTLREAFLAAGTTATLHEGQVDSIAATRFASSSSLIGTPDS